MTTGTATTERLLELLRIEGARLSRVPEAALDAPVPHLPDWTVERVLRHTGKVHRWVRAALDTAADGELPPVPSLPRGPSAIEAYAEALTNVVAALETRDPTDEAWTFRGAGDVAFWARRQAHEVAVHRFDAQAAIKAAGGDPVDPITPDGAVDGIDEWLGVFLVDHWAGRGERTPVEVRGTYHLHGIDEPAEWLITVDELIEVERMHAKGDVALRGPVADLFLTLWRRRSPQLLDRHGDVELADRLLDAVRI